MKKFTCIFLLLFITICYGQKEANIWYFGKNAGLDFNSGSPTALTDGQLNTLEGCASIADQNGNLLFYTDGITVWNKNHSVMLNGDGLNGHKSSSNSAIIIPKPNNSYVYYIFTVDETGQANGLQYSEVDITLDGGLGAITTNKNILLHTPVTEKLTAVVHENETDIWVVSHKHQSDEFIAYLITDLGVNTNPVISSTGSVVTNIYDAIGCIKISPNGKKLAVARADLNIQLFDFDASTGIISNPITLVNDHNAYYGIGFSPNGTLLYTTEGNRIFQYNLASNSETEILNSKTQIHLNSVFDDWYSLQIATDGKIYVAKGGQYLDVIKFPNSIGLSCHFVQDAVYLGGKLSTSGLPAFIQSNFNIGFSYEFTCFGDATKFSLNPIVDSVSWNFGDPDSGVNNTSTTMEPTHIFTASETYTVTATIVSGTASVVSTMEVEIFEVPTAYSVEDQVSYDAEEAGSIRYDLTTHATDVLNGQDPDLFSLTYFADINSYTNNEPLTSPNMFEITTGIPVDPVIGIENIGNFECVDFVTFNIEILVIEYPKFFTPNNDGENDTWFIRGVNEGYYPISTIQIYDRFGKIITNVTPNSIGWDGSYNGTSLPESDYWFIAQLIDNDGNIVNKKGHFSLIRRIEP